MGAPPKEPDKLKAVCEPRTTGWESYFSFLWPTREVAISSASAQSGGNYARQITTGTNGVWIFPHVFAAGNVSWDERTLPLMASAADLLPDTKLQTETAPLRAPTDRRFVAHRLQLRWRNRRAFEPNGTFASFHAPDVENSLPLIAARIVKQAPQASIKFVLRLDKDPNQGIIRIAFDGKRERQAWVRRAGEGKGQPFTGWEDGEFTPKTPKVGG